MQYRREIDGLRTFAILPVILFHAGIPGFSGGYAGVDVFFVISGFLITSILLGDLKKGKFSIVSFYEKRARRIIPALFFMLVCCVPFAFAWMSPLQFFDFSNSLIAVSVFVSNMFFWRTTDYFNPISEESPLLHTWSLAIEEQFYVLFPLILAFLYKFKPKYIFSALALLCAISLAIAQLSSNRFPGAGFFLLISRAWELGIGSLCALHLQKNGGQARHNQFGAILGVALLLVGMTCVDDETPWPSLWTLIPVVGTALIICCASPQAYIGKFLGTKPMVGLGLISYSAYLWHQPLFAFARIKIAMSPPWQLMVFLSLLSLVVAWASWKFVESPFRKPGSGLTPTRRSVFSSTAFVIFLAVGLGFYGFFTNGRENQWLRINDAKATTYALVKNAVHDIPGFDNGECIFRSGKMSHSVQARLIECSKKFGPGLAIFGDSHASNFFHGFISGEYGKFVFSHSAPGCRLSKVKEGCDISPFKDFTSKNDHVFSKIIYTQAGFYFLKDKNGKTNRAIIARVPEEQPLALDDYRISREEVETVSRILSSFGPKLVWLGPRLEPHINHGYVIKKGCENTYSLRPGQFSLYKMVDSAAQDAALRFHLSYFSQMPDSDVDFSVNFITCSAYYWRDGDHWSSTGSQYFVNKIMPRLQASGTP